MQSRRPVVCAYEDTDAARHALQAAVWLSRSLGSPLVLAHAFDPMEMASRPAREMATESLTYAELERQERLSAERALARVASHVAEVDVSTEVAEGPVVRALWGLLADRQASFVVTGTAARLGWERAMIGSVAADLAARAPCPLVAITRGAALEESGPVLVGYDGSDNSLRAARHASALAARLGREVVLVQAASATDAVEIAPEVRRGLPGETTVEVVQEEGEPAHVIATQARERSAALIVAGTRGRGHLGTAVLGSVTSELVRQAGRPVVVVPSSADDDPGENAG
jgi:nucleotide-binding universal stress UspA family protein